MSVVVGRTTIPYERHTAASCDLVPVSQRQFVPIRQRRAALRTLAGPSPAGSTLTTRTSGLAPTGSERSTAPSARPTIGHSDLQRESRKAIKVTRPRVEARETRPPSTSRRTNSGAARFPAAQVA